MTTKKESPAKKKTPKLAQASLGLFSEMDNDVFGSIHDEIMCWTDEHALEIIQKLWPEQKITAIGRKQWEMPVTVIVKGDSRLVGFVDLAVSLSKYPNRVYFEIKTRIRPGSDIRQINAYNHYLSGLADDTEGKRGPFVVVSPDDRHAKLLAEQGIKFVKYPDFLDVKL